MHPSHPTHRPPPRGISLLEVLISIGILAIGLTAVLSLIPAGRSYMQKAAIDDRAAALIPNAYSIVEDRGMFRVGALSWLPAPMGVSADPEPTNVVRSAKGGLWSATGQTQDHHWTIESTDSAVIEESWPRTTPPDLTGTTTGSSMVVVTTEPPSSEFSGTTGPDGAWKIPLGANLPAPDLKIVESGPGVGTPANQPFVDYTFKAAVQVSGSFNPISVTPSTYRQYGALRKRELRRGRAQVTYAVPSPDPRRNDSSDQATAIDLKPIRSTTVVGRNSITSSAQVEVEGTLWRMATGVREGTYEQSVNFPAAVFPAAASFDDPKYTHMDLMEDVGDAWVGSPSSAEDVDWYRFPVEDAVVVELAWTDPGNILAVDAFGARCPLYLDSPTNPIQPFETGAGWARYWIPKAGTAFTKLALGAGPPNTFGPTGAAPNMRINPGYGFTVTVSRVDRAIAFDPLMATRLDKIIDLGGSAAHRLRRQRFASFQQQLGGQERAFVIPRLSLQELAAMPVDQAIAAAERLFRDDDVIAVDPPANDEDPPNPRFEISSSGAPLRRMASGRMTWMMLIQPQDPGTVMMNWSAGKLFDVSFVIFQDRKLPPLDASAPLEGEYAFSGSWSDATGMLSVTVPFDVDGDGGRDLVAEDIRAVFRSGNWMLLAPAQASTSPPFSDTQRLEWVRIRTAEILSEADSAVVRVLLEAEPNADVLVRSAYAPGTLDFPLAVLAYEGVVAVVNKPLQLEP